MSLRALLFSPQCARPPVLVCALSMARCVASTHPADGDVCGVEVVLEVTPLLPRLMVGPVAVRGALSCGLPQWLGIALAPLEPPGPQPQDPGAAGQAAGGGGSGGGGGGAGAAKGAAAGEEGVQSGGLQFARVHVQVGTLKENCVAQSVPWTAWLNRFPEHFLRCQD